MSLLKHQISNIKPLAVKLLSLDFLPEIFLASLTFIVYLNTLVPGVVGFDSAELATGTHTMGIVHPPGYPLYILIGQLFIRIPLGDIAYRLNIMSAFFGALTVLWGYKIIFIIVNRRDLAWAAAALFAVSNYFWIMALVAEVYTLHTYLLALNLWLLLKWRQSGESHYLFGFAFFYGLSLTNHTSGILFAPGYLWLIHSSENWVWRISKIARLGGLFVLGLLPYLYLPLRVLADPNLNYVDNYYGVDLLTPGGLWWMVSGEAYRFFAFGYNWSEISHEFAHFFSFLWRNFMGIGVFLGIIGILESWRKQRDLLISLLLIFGVNVIFFANYRVIDKETMFLPAFFVWAIIISWGMRRVIVWWNLMITKDFLIPAVKPAIRVMFIGLGLLTLVINWKWVDMSDNYGPQRFAEQVLNSVDQDALIVAPWSSAVVLEYYQVVLGSRPDITIYNKSRTRVAQYYLNWREGNSSEEIWKIIRAGERNLIDAEIKLRTVYMVEYEPRLAYAYEYLPEGSVFRLKPIDILDFVRQDG